MSRSFLLSAVLMLVAGCPKVDDDTDTPTATDEQVEDAAIVGAWVSTGADIAPLLVAGGFTDVQADFLADSTYSVAATSEAGTFTFTGTFTVDDSTSPATITLEQDAPFTATATGIWEVEAGVLTYEVVQTSPDQGFSPPTVAGGFGSTAGPGIEAGVNVQTFR